MNTITDDQIAEIEALAKSACEYTQTDWFSPSDLSESLADEDARFVGAAGPFTVRALIARLREAEKDAARYRFIREVASGEYEDFDVVAGAAFDAAYGRARNFDLSIDEAMLSAREAAE